MTQSLCDVEFLLGIPDHLRRTFSATYVLGTATASQVAEQTHRARAVESGYLNQLVTMGYMQKDRQGRKALFSTNKVVLRRASLDEIMRRISFLPDEQQSMLADDIFTALINRLLALERANKHGRS